MFININFWNFEDLKNFYEVVFSHFANKMIFAVDLLNGCETEITVGVAGESEMCPHGEGCACWWWWQDAWYISILLTSLCSRCGYLLTLAFRLGTWDSIDETWLVPSRLNKSKCVYVFEVFEVKNWGIGIWGIEVQN